MRIILETSPICKGPVGLTLKLRSGTADGWTDCATYIAIDRKFLRKLEMDLEGYIQLGHLVMHEICHHEASIGSHTHDEHFYREFTTG
jgi:hypothetical protein